MFSQFVRYIAVLDDVAFEDLRGSVSRRGGVQFHSGIQANMKASVTVTKKNRMVESWTRSLQTTKTDPVLRFPR